MGADETALAKPQTAEEMMKELRDKVRLKIKQAFINLVPEVGWKALVEAELKAFTEPEYNSYTRQYSASPFKRMLHEFIAEKFKALLKEEFEKPEWVAQIWGQFGSAAPSEAIKKLMKELLPDIMQAAFGGVMQRAVDAVRQSLGTF